MLLQSFCWTLAAFSVSQSYTQSVRLLGGGISPSQGRCVHTKWQKRTQTSMPWVRFEPRIPGFERAKTFHGHRPRGHCDRPVCRSMCKQNVTGPDAAESCSWSSVGKHTFQLYLPDRTGHVSSSLSSRYVGSSLIIWTKKNNFSWCLKMFRLWEIPTISGLFTKYLTTFDFGMLICLRLTLW
jgi:hypothetical protein